MNTRDYKPFARGGIFHIFNRGNGKMPIFKDKQDFLNFLKRIKLLLLPMVPIGKERIQIKPLPQGAFDIITYGLIPNHFHFEIRQNTNLNINKFIHPLCSSYGKYFNKKYDHVGGLYQDQFKAVEVTSNEQLLRLSGYIHLNPVRSGLAQVPIDYRWSSYPEYMGKEGDGICAKNIILDQFDSPDDYDRYVKKLLSEV